MRKFALALFLAASAAIADDGTLSGIEKIDLGHGIYQFKSSYDGYVSNTNSTVIVNRDDVLVFDTNTRPSTARAIVAEIRKITPKPVRYVVNSHWHPDHWSGNEVYAREFPGVEIIATEQARRYMKNVSPAWPAVFAGNLKRRKEAFEKESEADRKESAPYVAVLESFVAESQTIQRTLPTRTYRDAMTLKPGGREIRFFSLVGDASDSTVLYLPKEKVLLSGDLVVHPITWTTQSYRITPWIESLKKLSQLDVDVIVPGHGPALRDKSYLALVVELFETAIAQVEAALARGLVTVDEVQQAVKLDAVRAKFTKGDADLEAQFNGTATSLVRKVYLEARDGMESKR